MKVAKGFGVRCPKCGDDSEPLTIDLNDVGEITCRSCDASYTATQARDRAAEELARWERVVRWVNLAPQMIGENPGPDPRD